MIQIWPPVPHQDRLTHCVSCMPEDFSPERLKPYGVSGERRLSMQQISSLNGCIGCGPMYGPQFSGLRAFDSKPITTAMIVIGLLVAGGLVLSAMASKKKKAA